MLIGKRQLKKDRKKTRFKFLVIFFIVILMFLALGEYIFLNFPFGNVSYVSPVSKNKNSIIIFVENELNKENIKFSEISASSGGSIKVDLTEGGEVILSSKKDVGSQISSLQLILSRLTIEGKKLNILDFSFDNPVVSYN